MSCLDFIVLTLAASAIVDVWFNGSIFADWRAFFQSKADDPIDEPITDTTASQDDEEDEGDPLPWLMQLADKWVPRPIAELVSCSFCFSHHTPWVVGLLFVFAEVVEAIYAPPIVPEMGGGFWINLCEWTIRPVAQPYPFVQPLVLLIKLPAYSLAATRLGSMLNSYLPREAKYHRE